MDDFLFPNFFPNLSIFSKICFQSFSNFFLSIFFLNVFLLNFSQSPHKDAITFFKIFLLKFFFRFFFVEQFFLSNALVEQLVGSSQAKFQFSFCRSRINFDGELYLSSETLLLFSVKENHMFNYFHLLHVQKLISNNKKNLK